MKSNFDYVSVRTEIKRTEAYNKALKLLLKDIPTIKIINSSYKSDEP